MLRRDIAASSLKIRLENFDPVKSYDKTNMTIFALSLWENYRMGLTSFGQFIIEVFILMNSDISISFGTCHPANSCTIKSIFFSPCMKFYRKRFRC